MQDDHMKKIGIRIKNYRKSKQMTLDQLATRINKSKGTLSKYENGSIMIDIQSLYDIADALEINVWQFLDISNHTYTESSTSDIFEKVHSFYLYTLDKNTRSIVSSIIEVFKNETTLTATLFWNLTSYSDYNCEMIYHGTSYSFDTTLSFFLHNQWNPIDQLYINLTKPLGNYYWMVGLLTGYSAHPIYPVCKKAVVSYRIIKDQDMLKDVLNTSSADIRELQKSNQFSVRRDV